MNPRKKILRPNDALERLACGRTKFDEDYRHHSNDDPYVPGTDDVPRLKAIPLSERNIGYLESEVDALVDALVARRDAVVAQSPRAAIAAEGRLVATERRAAQRAEHKSMIAASQDDNRRPSKRLSRSEL
jgi:hypothetical protein